MSERQFLSDSAVGMRLRNDLREMIAKRKDALVANNTDRNAGFVQGLEAALALIEDPPTTEKRD